MAACTAAVIAVALIIFMVQNTDPVEVTFLWMTATTSLALMLLIAAVGGAVVTLILGSARIIQLRLAIHRKPTGPPIPLSHPTAQPDNANRAADMTDDESQGRS